MNALVLYSAILDIPTLYYSIIAGTNFKIFKCLPQYYLSAK